MLFASETANLVRATVSSSPATWRYVGTRKILTGSPASGSVFDSYSRRSKYRQAAEARVDRLDVSLEDRPVAGARARHVQALLIEQIAHAEGLAAARHRAEQHSALAVMDPYLEQVARDGSRAMNLIEQSEEH